MGSVVQSKHIRRYINVYLMILPAMFFFFLFLVFPLIKSFQMSMYNYNGFGKMVDFIAFQNYLEALRDRSFWNSLGNNLILVVCDIIISTTIAFFLAYFLYKRVPGWKFFNVSLFMPAMIPLVVTAVIWSVIYEPNIGLLNSLLDHIGVPGLKRVWIGNTDTALGSVIVVWIWKTIPFNMLIIFGSMLRIPEDLLDAARIDGARESKVIRHIIAPLVVPTLVLLIVLTLANDFRSFDIVQVLTNGGPVSSTEIATTYVYKMGFGLNKYGYANALAFLVFLVVGAFTLVLYFSGRKFFKPTQDE